MCVDNLLPIEEEDVPAVEADITCICNLIILSLTLVTTIPLVGVVDNNRDPSLFRRAVHPSSRREVDRTTIEVSRTTLGNFMIVWLFCFLTLASRVCYCTPPEIIDLSTSDIL